MASFVPPLANVMPFVPFGEMLKLAPLELVPLIIESLLIGRWFKCGWPKAIGTVLMANLVSFLLPAMIGLHTGYMGVMAADSIPSGFFSYFEYQAREAANPPPPGVMARPSIGLVEGLVGPIFFR